MTNEDAKKLITRVIAAYPQSDKYNSKEQVKAVTDLWAEMFEDDNSKLVTLALKKHVATSKWPPSIAEIRKIMAEIQHPELLPPDQAWAYVSNILTVMRESHFTGIFSNSKDAPQLIQETIASLGGWDRLLELNRGVSGSYKNAQCKDVFLSQYKPAYERELEKAMLPAKTRDMLDRAANQLGKKTLAAIEIARDNRIDSESRFQKFS